MRNPFQSNYSGRGIYICTRQKRLHFYNGNTNPWVYSVALGKTKTPTPHGRYHVTTKVVNPGGVLGSRWMGLNISQGNYGIHGTNLPSSIGTYASNGCVRMYNRDIERIFPLVSIGTPVIIGDSKTWDKYYPSNCGYSTSKNPSVPTSTNNKKSYVVKNGDSLWSIAQKLKVSLESLIRANSSIDPNKLIPGQIINIP